MVFYSKRLSLPLFISTLVYLASCQNNGKSYTVDTTDTVVGTQPTSLPLDFQSLETEGIAIGDKITLLNDSLVPIDTLKNEGRILQITGISTPTQVGLDQPAPSQEHKPTYIKVKMSLGDAIIDGQQVYSPSTVFSPKVTQIGNNKFSFTPLENYSASATKVQSTASSTSHFPILFTNSEDGYKGLIKQINNNIFESEFPFLELMKNDQISEVNVKNDAIILQIVRADKGTLAFVTVKIDKDPAYGYRAEIMSIENKK